MTAATKLVTSATTDGTSTYFTDLTANPSPKRRGSIKRG
jgi:hypothetical protein